MPPASRSTFLKAEAIMTVAWYWVLFHVWYEWDHLVVSGRVILNKKSLHFGQIRVVTRVPLKPVMVELTQVNSAITGFNGTLVTSQISPRCLMYVMPIRGIHWHEL